MPPHPLTNFEIEKCYQNEPNFNKFFMFIQEINGVYSRNKLPKIKDGAYVISLDEYKSTGTQWIVLYVNGNNIMHFDSSTVEHTFKEIYRYTRNKNGISNICRIQTFNSIIFACFCIGFIDFILKGVSLLDSANLFFS